MGDFKIASDGLVREAEYLRGVGEAQASISQAIMGFPALYPIGGHGKL